MINIKILCGVSWKAGVSKVHYERVRKQKYLCDVCVQNSLVTPHYTSLFLMIDTRILKIVHCFTVFTGSSWFPPLFIIYYLLCNVFT